MAKKEKKTGVDLTHGSIAKGIVSFAVPLLFTSVVQQLYSTVDLLFVGNYLGTEAAAALGISMLLITCLVGLLTGMSVGVNIVIGQLFGAKKNHEVDRALHTAWLVGAIGGALLAVFGFFFAPTYIELMETPEEVVGPARQYLQVYFIAMVAVSIYNMEAGIARSLGNSKSPMWAQTVGGLMNVAANYLFIVVLGMGIMGAAVATLISNAVAAIYLLFTLKGIPESFRLRREGFCLDGGYVKRILVVGLPIGIQSCVITFSNVIIQHQIDLLGVSAIAAFTAYYKVELPIYYGIVALGQAATTFVSQNHGAGDHARMRKGSHVVQAMTLGFTVVMSAVMLAIGYWAFYIFVPEDPLAIEYGLQIISVLFPLYFIYAILEVQADVMRGLGHSIPPAVVVIINLCILRTAVLLFLTGDGVTVDKVAICYPISWTTTAICMIVGRILVERKEGHPLVCKDCGKPLDMSHTHVHGAGAEHVEFCTTCDGRCMVQTVELKPCGCPVDEECQHGHWHTHEDGHTHFHEYSTEEGSGHENVEECDDDCCLDHEHHHHHE